SFVLVFIRVRSVFHPWLILSSLFFFPWLQLCRTPQSVASTPPRADGVVDQELDHIALGEELRYRGKRSPIDLMTALVDVVLFLALPELIDPTQAIVGGENLGRQARQQLFEGKAVVGGQLDIQEHIVNPKDLGQHTT